MLTIIRRLFCTTFLPLVLFATTVGTGHAVTLEEQAKSLEKKAQTVDQRRKTALKDLNESVLKGYRDALIVESVDTSIGEVFDRTVRVDVKVAYAYDFEKMRAVKASLDKYFDTDTNKEPGVEPYGMIYINFNDCVGEYCAVQQEMKRLLEWTAVGVQVKFMGLTGTHVTSDMLGHYDIKPGTVTLQFDVPKAKLKGDPKPVVTAQVFDSHFCPDDPDCNGRRYTARK